MNKAELISAIAEESGLSKVDTRKAVDAFMQVVNETLTQGDRVALVGFGSFSVVERSARMGRNPQTGAEMEIAAKKVVKFSPGAELKAAVN
jgi:DNA-binding protein HU-beta